MRRGDVVCLNSGGPDMVVVTTPSADGRVSCAWEGAHGVEVESFDVVTVRPIDGCRADAGSNATLAPDVARVIRWLVSLLEENGQGGNHEAKAIDEARRLLGG